MMHGAGSCSCTGSCWDASLFVYYRMSCAVRYCFVLDNGSKPCYKLFQLRKPCPRKQVWDSASRRLAVQPWVLLQTRDAACPWSGDPLGFRVSTQWCSVITKWSQASAFSWVVQGSLIDSLLVETMDQLRMALSWIHSINTLCRPRNEWIWTSCLSKALGTAKALGHQGALEVCHSMFFGIFHFLRLVACTSFMTENAQAAPKAKKVDDQSEGLELRCAVDADIIWFGTMFQQAKVIEWCSLLFLCLGVSFCKPTCGHCPQSLAQELLPEGPTFQFLFSS